MVLFVVLWGIIYYRAPPHQWGDLSQAIIYHQVRKYLLMLDARKAHVKFWRPAVILFADNLESNQNLIEFANQLKKGGLYVLASVVLGTVETRGAEMRDVSHRGWDMIRRTKIKAFYELAIAQSVRAGVANITLIAGLGGMRPNTVIFGFWQEHSNQATLEPLNPEHSIQVEEYVGLIRDSLLFEKNVLLARNFDFMDKAAIKQQRRLNAPMSIDIWDIGECSGGGTDSSYQLSLQLGYVLQKSEFFHKYCKLRVMTLVPTLQDIPRTQIRIKEILLESRIPVDHAEVLAMSQPQDILVMQAETRHGLINEMIRAHSSKTAVLFIPISRPPEIPSHYGKYIQELDILSQRLPPSILVHGLTNVITNEL